MITLIGLGPGDAGLLTRQAWEWLVSSQELYACADHPVLRDLPPTIHVSYLSERQDTPENILRLGRRPQGITLALAGHPLFDSRLGHQTAKLAQECGLELRVAEGVSITQAMLAALGLESHPHLALVAAWTLDSWHIPPFSPSYPALINQIFDADQAQRVVKTVAGLYPLSHPVRLVHWQGGSGVQVEELPLGQVAEHVQAGAPQGLFLPPLGQASGFEAMAEVVAHLRAPQGGCPWDLKQTHLTLRADLLEEVYELLGAIDAGNLDGIREELGDVLLHLLLQAQIAADAGEFTIADVLSGVHTKIVGRHPHVFGETVVAGEQNVLQNWEKLKAQERRAKGQAGASILDGINLALPALVQAQQFQKRARHVGFEWSSLQGVWNKLYEELQEVQAAHNATELSDELGDVLFMVANLALWHTIDAESALREANVKFRRRFSYMEERACQEGKALDTLRDDEWSAYWQAAKQAGDR